MCKFCCLEYAYPNATRMTNHILNCKKCPLEIKNKYKKCDTESSSSSVIASMNKNENSEPVVIIDEDESFLSTSSSSSVAESSLPSKRKKLNSQQILSGFFDKIAVPESFKIDKAVARALYACGAPFSFFCK